MEHRLTRRAVNTARRRRTAMDHRRGIIQQQRIQAALEAVQHCGRHYWETIPHAFGQLQDAIREAKKEGATTIEIAVILQNV
jgi:hypothetical protein